MSSRKPGYLIGVILLALAMSAPQLMIGFQFAVEAYQYGSLPSPPIPGFGNAYAYQNLLSSVTFWQDQFIYVSYGRHNPNGNVDWTLQAIDPETGKTTTSDLALSNRAGFQPMAFGDRLWLVDYTGSGSSYEVVDGVARPSTFLNPPGWPQDGQRFLLNGEAAYVEKSPQGYTVSTFQKGAWGIAGDVVLPNSQREWVIGKTPVNFQRVTDMTLFHQGDRIHVLLYVDGCLLHREGLELQPSAGLFSRQFNRSGGSADEPVSALRATNAESAIEGWSVVRARVMRSTPSHIHAGGLLFVGGQLAALIVDDMRTGYPIGHLYRFDGTSWSEFATQDFPFGTNQIRAVSCRDQQKAYIVAATTTGAAQVYAVEAAGIRPTNGAAPQMNQALQTLVQYGMVPIGMLVLGIVLGVGTWLLMWLYTKPDYGFGVQTVKLASLGRRGLARLIDLALIVFSTAGLGWMMTRGFDWLSWVEALNLNVDHPTIPIAGRVASILALWLVVVVLSLLVVQARWGVTPGKWLCGLRTLRTTLKPCGFARSLVRETVMYVDACNFLCWAPGILSIALTDCRQRLGDLVADTLVVEVRSLSRRMPA